MGKYSNTNTAINCISGSSVRIKIGTTPYEGTATTTLAQGTDTPCKYCRLQVATGNSAVVRVKMGAAPVTSSADATTGVVLPAYPTLTPYSIENLSELYFKGTDGDYIDIEYFT
jgi:hypothetical protein